MHPIIDLAGFQVSAYRLFTLLALAAAVAITVPVAHRRGLGTTRIAIFLGITLVAALVGARVLATGTAAHPFRGGASEVFALRAGNMAMFGGLVGGLLGGLGAAALVGERPARLADHTAPAIGVGIVLLRVGCLMAGCCFGRETALPWGITYPEGAPANLEQRAASIWGLFGSPSPVHPVQVYEMVAAAGLAGLALLILRRGARDGTAFAVVVGGYALARTAIQPFRVAIPGSAPGWFYPALYVAFAGVAAAWAVAPVLRGRAIAARHSALRA